ncbi:hypothetical protein FHS43_000569 [Streptosporangium becharense]|uniref:Uncharacterized protein n=1 Tax=Streptosporangium becharense TaxID=1816182 RepID=A0A7W9IN23_9ACTN|nr:hypothetical protein [Streptosporangium becharense]MBB2909323.1 hypothetical protein [Streptosporangium becharense]MBB5823774.1 hypothetical protein [Streptosporangium becharense]
MAKLTLTNISGDTRSLGRPDGLPVQAGDVVAVDGQFLEELSDAYLIDQGGQIRAWPKETWQLSGTARTGAAGASGAAAKSKGGTES